MSRNWAMAATVSSRLYPNAAAVGAPYFRASVRSPTSN